jgi:hypothetical protein
MGTVSVLKIDFHGDFSIKLGYECFLCGKTAQKTLSPNFLRRQWELYFNVSSG